MKHVLLAIIAATGLSAQEMPKPNYCFFFLTSAPNRPTLPEAEAKQIQAGHLAHLTALGDKGWLVAAGPLTGNNAKIRGLGIAKCESVEESIRVESDDPAVKAGLLAIE